MSGYGFQIFCYVSAMVGLLATAISMLMTFMFVSVVMPNMPFWMILIGLAVVIAHVVPAGMFISYLTKTMPERRWLAVSGVLFVAVLVAFIGWYFATDPSPNSYLYLPYMTEAICLAFISFESLTRRREEI